MSKGVHFRNGRHVSHAQIRNAAFYPQWQILLKAAWGQAERPVCTCCSHGQRLGLVVKRHTVRHRGSDVYRYWLARLPKDGPRHDTTCPFYARETTHQINLTEAIPVVQHRADGHVALRLNYGLKCLGTVKTAQEADTPSQDRSQRAQRSAQQPAMRLLGLLQFLWERAGLHRWDPADAEQRQHWSFNRMHLMRAAQNIMVGAYPLERCIIAPGYRDGEHEQALRERLTFCHEQSLRCVCLAQVQSIAAAERPAAWRGEKRYTKIMVDQPRPTSGRAPILTIEAPYEKLAHLRRSYTSEMRVIEHFQQARADRYDDTIARDQKRRFPTSRVIAIVSGAVKLWKDGRFYLAADDYALMRVSLESIPVESAHELRLAQALVREKRFFEKPLRYQANASPVHPDFLLHDAGVPGGLPMEVFGMDTPAYQTRKEEKITYYTQAYGDGGWWSWDATHSPDTLPDMPPPLRDAT